ncbi:MAG: tetratricopeptide repeat protein [Microcystis panniformis Mp_MB_F_20051200_S9]|uniref:Tetratricopeptide repeat protein n=1 Tax=Microcystis panniformis Mp_MB_F_20051200_S9 TaxID=2486223 RepID=A0A552PN02_9CHRO|nr:MAG: tetratricopeptide repeat protein [Microcystis panniformis Mp_MB_F_20080800_S26D]TRV49104.1 MAG: tetratricopeptide repeat protein [Microcystis panniformis Mp_GB_SS_20050300_S99D]TRV50810.1 MAG: tetratricopeptide repeat protein [Microcystis panniformis Mp_GB_SS_20050300_S99]TRV58364.1 MAG: tetratricopeptide repeat protein [Microcystis panniformis Mp_MB_F_20051200_S9]TRV64500.1 MAG: tetratricopeptide repeat protein [Microcystis panniformis Mp_MB_F_20080800_S26]TRV67922.1 MAG: tetratricope
MNNETSSIIDQNEREYEGLIVSLEANQERLNILICVCDQEKLREEIIDRYSKELEPVIPCYRIDLDQKEPSLRAAIASLVSRKPELLQSKNAVITTTGVEKLHSIEWQREKSELDKFFGYLQWTREGLREFPYSIVLWVTSIVEVNLRKKSPDFWSWRKGVFRFISPPSNFLPCQEFLPILQSFDEITIDKDIPSISKEDLLELIEQIEVNKSKKEPRLASLYASLAKIYKNRLLNLPLSDYRQEQQLAIEYYQKAIDLQKELNLELDLVASLDSLAGIYYFLGEYQKAIEFYQQSLAITREIGDRGGEGKSYNNLGNVYHSLGEYQKAIEFYQQSLAIKREIGDRGGEAKSYNNLGNVYYSLGEYQKAIEFHQQSLAIKREISDITGEAYSYLGLGNVYDYLGEYQKAIKFYQQSLEIFQEMECIIGEPKTLFNLGVTYYKLKRIAEAKEAYLQARKLFQALGLAGYVQYCDQAIRQL